MPELSFLGRVEADGEAIFIRVPGQVIASLGQGKRAPVTVTLNGSTFRSRIAVYGGKYYLGLRRDVRVAAGVAPGDELEVCLAYDAEPRIVDLPAELRDLLMKDPRATEAYERLSYTHRRELMLWISEAKLEETRRRRLTQALQMLRQRPPRGARRG